MAGKGSYDAATREVLELFADYIEGGPDLPALSLSQRSLPENARNAIKKSLEFFGFGAESCTFATIFPKNESVEGGDIPLDAQSLFLLVEDLDPLFVICADAPSAEAAAQAYRMQLSLDEPARIFGRPAVVFADLPALLQTSQGKQKAWSLLKAQLEL